MIPFFVVDRPISLEILKGIKLSPGQQIGLMAHANTSKNFRRVFRAYPKNQAIKMCDSAIFHSGANTYEELFTKYEEMGADYGVVIDVLRDANATIRSARRALRAYNPKSHHFKLVAVAQGTTIDEYMDCYKKLRELGYKHIAVGGLLHRRERSARYMFVRDEGLMREVLSRIRKEFNPEWMFALGCLRSSRLELFKMLNVWGDYKGWIFEYKKRDESLKEIVHLFSTNHLMHAPIKLQTSRLGIDLLNDLSKRQVALQKAQRVHDKLFTAKKGLRDLMIEIDEELRKIDPAVSLQVRKFKFRSLFGKADSEHIFSTLSAAKLHRRYGKRLEISILTIRKLKTKFVREDKKREEANQALLSKLRRVEKAKTADSNIKMVAKQISQILEVSEQTHRITQVRTYIRVNILERIQ